MKNLFLLGLFLTSILFTGNLRAQMSVLDEDGNTIEDGQTFNFTSTEENIAKLHFYIKNDNPNAINVKAKILEMTGTDGTQAQFCMGECLYFIEEGTVVPEDGAYSVAANTTDDSTGTYFWNRDDSEELITYKIKIYQINDIGGETGTPITINYIYDGTMALDSPNLMETAQVYPSIVKDYTNINIKENATASIFNLQGKLIKTVELEAGSTEIDCSTMTAGVYLISLKGASNSVATKKIVKI